MCGVADKIVDPRHTVSTTVILWSPGNRLPQATFFAEAQRVGHLPCGPVVRCNKSPYSQQTFCLPRLCNTVAHKGFGHNTTSLRMKTCLHLGGYASTDNKHTVTHNMRTIHSSHGISGRLDNIVLKVD